MRLLVRGLRGLANWIEQHLPSPPRFMCSRCGHDMTACRSKPPCRQQSLPAGLTVWCCQCAHVNRYMWATDETKPIVVK